MTQQVIDPNAIVPAYSVTVEAPNGTLDTKFFQHESSADAYAIGALHKGLKVLYNYINILP